MLRWDPLPSYPHLHPHVVEFLLQQRMRRLRQSLQLLVRCKVRRSFVHLRRRLPERRQGIRFI